MDNYPEGRIFPYSIVAAFRESFKQNSTHLRHIIVIISVHRSWNKLDYGDIIVNPIRFLRFRKTMMCALEFVLLAAEIKR